MARLAGPAQLSLAGSLLVSWQVIVISQANRLDLITASHNIVLFTGAEIFIMFL